MRIIGGEYRGRRLNPPVDKRIRPTSDRMRETIFNILSHRRPALRGARVLDAFAGTGALGLEALSRGAAHVSFFDRDRRALQLVKKNIALLKAEDKTTVRCVIAPNFPPASRPYDIIFLDPPYPLDLISGTLETLERKNHLAENCLIIAEYQRGKEIIFPEFLQIIQQKTCGDAQFSFLQKSA